MQARIRGFWCAALLLIASAAGAQERWIAQGRGTLVIDPDGSVADVDVSGQFDPRIETAVIDQMRAWRFEPIVEQGRAVRVHAYMGFELHAVSEPRGQQARLTIEDVHFYDPPAKRQGYVSVEPPEYPMSMLRKQLGGSVRLLVEIDADGRVLRAAQESGRLYANRNAIAGADKAMQAFAQASIDAVQDWRFTPAADGRPYKVTVPITFNLGGTTWQRAHEVAVVQEPWVIAADAEAVAAYGADGTAPNPRIRLKASVEDEAAGS